MPLMMVALNGCQLHLHATRLLIFSAQGQEAYSAAAMKQGPASYSTQALHAYTVAHTPLLEPWINCCALCYPLQILLALFVR